MKRILIIGLGHVGSAIALAISKNRKENDNYKNVELWGYDINENRIKEIEDGDDDDFLNLHLDYITSDRSLLKDISDVIVCMSTKQDSGYISATNIYEELNKIKFDKEVRILVKSTIPVGFTEYLSKMLLNSVFFSPEFLREGREALGDLDKKYRVYLSYNEKLINNKSDINITSQILKLIYCNSKEIRILPSAEAEMMKLARNAYLAMRVSFFNEVANLCRHYEIDPEECIDNMCEDPRIGSHYNDLSFGFGGYCLPKDSYHLERMCQDKIEEYPLLSSLDDSNTQNLFYHANRIRDRIKKTVVIYGIGFKRRSDNITESAMMNIAKLLATNTDCNIIFWELTEDYKEIINNWSKTLGHKVWTKMTDSNYHSPIDRIQVSKDMNLIDKDTLIVTEWYMDDVHKLFKEKECEIYYPGLL